MNTKTPWGGMVALAVGLVMAISGFPGSLVAGTQPPHESRERRGSVESVIDASQKTTVTLDELVKAALEGNAGLSASMESVQAAKQMVLPARTLPDPMFTFQNMGDLIPPRLQAEDPSSGRFFTIEQEFPFPGKLDLKGQIASTEADVQELGHSLVHLQLISAVKVAYYDLFFIHESLKTVRKSKDLLQEFVEIARTRYAVGQGIQQDVIKAQVELSKLIDRLVTLVKELKMAEARINDRLNRPVGTPVGAPAEFKKAELTYALEDLLKLAETGSPTIRTRRLDIDRRQLGVQLAEKEFYPDFALGLTYVDRGDQPEMYGLMFKAKLPIYFWRKQAPELHAARANLAGAKMMLRETTSDVGLQIRESFVAATTADQLAELYYSAIIPHSRLSLESAMVGYQTGKVDFLTLLDSLLTLLDYELKYHEAVSEFQKALARLEPLAGIELTK